MDPRSPLVLSTHELGRRPGAMRSVRRTVPAPDDLAAELAAVEPGSDLDLDLRLEAVMEGVLVSGSVHARVSGECGRCLDAISEWIDVAVQELFVYPGRVAEGDDDEEDLPEVESGELVDIETTVRDAVVTALPFQPLCRPDCPGLCPRCGARLADVDQPHLHQDTDPRWGALEALGGGAEGGAGPGRAAAAGPEGTGLDGTSPAAS